MTNFIKIGNAILNVGQICAIQTFELPGTDVKVIVKMVDGDRFHLNEQETRALEAYFSRFTEHGDRVFDAERLLKESDRLAKIVTQTKTPLPSTHQPQKENL